MNDDRAATGVTYEGEELLAHLRDCGVLPPGQYTATALAGGVSSRIVLIEGGGRRLVAKQARARLTVVAEWLSDPARAGREIACIEALEALARQGHVPRIVWTDTVNNGYVMEAAPAEACTWKDLMLASDPERATVATAAQVLAAMHATEPTHETRVLFEDLTVFDQLRLDPYYGRIAEVHPGVASTINAHRAALGGPGSALVHGDFSPKNVLIWDDAFLLLDYEVAHWGDPAFDIAFLLSHLALHGFTTPRAAAAFGDAAMSFWRDYASASDSPAGLDDLERRVAGNYACLLLARVDGKSPVDHLHDARALDAVRELALALLRDPVDGIGEALARTRSTQEVL